MTQEPQSPAVKPRLDDLLQTMGITQEQLAGMTAEDLFAAATRCQDAATLPAADVEGVAPSPVGSPTAGRDRGDLTDPVASAG